MRLSEKQIVAFRRELLMQYDRHGRHELPWRQPEADGTFDPYKIWVSELMLQQTQVNRVIPKYEAFLRQFPDVSTLATANLGEVLVAWQGLGYNRRAQYLWLAARQLVEAHDGTVPSTLAELEALPGIGCNTAGAILAYAYNQPAIFVETNVRTVYFHHFFKDQQSVTDKELISLIKQTVPTEQGNTTDLSYRDFYWALMDYGSYLKRQGHGNINQSKHYAKQSKFEGSARQVRGRALRVLAQGPMSRDDMLAALADERGTQVIEALEREGMISRTGETYRLA